MGIGIGPVASASVENMHETPLSSIGDGTASCKMWLHDDILRSVPLTFLFGRSEVDPRNLDFFKDELQVILIFGLF